MAYLQAFVVCLLALSAAAAPRTQLTGLLNRVERSNNETSPGEDRIIGGQPVPEGKLTFVGGLSNQYLSHICGSSIIALRYALTAAHCTYGTFPSSLLVAAGSNNMLQQLRFAVEQIIQNPSYDPRTIDNDISILRTRDPIQGRNIAIVPLAAANQELKDGTKLVVAGFGLTIEGGLVSPILREAEVEKLPHTECQARYAPISITPNMLCAAAPGKNACQGDSGSPLVKQDPAGLVSTQFGIVSFGIGCANPKYPGVYTDLTAPGIRKFVQDHAHV